MVFRKKPRIWDPRKTRNFQNRLLDWYSRHKRELPWRSDPTPYRVWVSEIMLQQTQVSTTLPYYAKFLSRFPDVRSLAAASEEEVLAHWAGLGYYQRARNIHRAARKILQEWDGEFPRTMEQTLKLPGIGRYTAGAIHSIAFNRPEPVVDGNVRRVISRLHGIRIRAPEGFFWKQSMAWLAERCPADFNQAVMELGALVCLPSEPRCGACPVAVLCAAHKLHIQHLIPPKRPLPATLTIELVILIIERKGSVLLSNKLPSPYIPGTWGLPARSLQQDELPEEAARALAHSMHFKSISLQKASIVRHGITYRRMAAHVYHLKVASGIPASRDPRFRWVTPADAGRLLTSSLFRKALTLCPASFH